MKIKVENKVTFLSDTLKEFFGDKMNLAHIKFISNALGRIKARIEKSLIYKVGRITSSNQVNTPIRIFSNNLLLVVKKTIVLK